MAVNNPTDELGKIYSAPIQRHFKQLVTDCDPSKLVDYLFEKNLLDVDDMDKIQAKQTSDGRSAAARTLFLALVQRAKTDKTFEAVDALIYTLREVGTTGGSSLAEDIATAKGQAERELTRYKESGKRSVEGTDDIDGGSTPGDKKTSQWQAVAADEKARGSLAGIPLDRWECVVTPMRDHITEAIEPFFSDIGLKCVSASLIRNQDFSKLYDLSKAGQTSRACHELITLLMGSKNAGFAKFKAILRTWPEMSALQYLLRKIEVKEEQICGSKLPDDYKDD